MTPLVMDEAARVRRGGLRTRRDLVMNMDSARKFYIEKGGFKLMVARVIPSAIAAEPLSNIAVANKA